MARPNPCRIVASTAAPATVLHVITDLSSGQVDCTIVTYPAIIGVWKSELRF